MKDNPLAIFEPYLSDERVTDINYNGMSLWVDSLDFGRKSCEFNVTSEEVMNACIRFSDRVNCHFNIQYPVLEAEYQQLRISMIHPSVSGRISISIRKTPALVRIDATQCIKEGYATQSALKFLINAVCCRCNIIVSGLPGAGKTELIKFLTTYIDERSRVITIEDTRELHYDVLHPHRDSVSIKVDNHFSYEEAIKASMRQRPEWLLVSEVRGQEVEDLLRSISTGAHLLSTVHAQSAFDIPKRFMYMMAHVDITNEILQRQLFDALDIGVHVACILKDNKPFRFIQEIVAFENGAASLIYHHHSKRSVKSYPNFIKQQARIYEVKIR